MTERYISTTSVRDAVRGREREVLEALKIAWQDGAPHLTCPGRGSDAVFDVVMKLRGDEGDEAKIVVAEAGHVHLVQRRRGDFDFIYLAISAGSASRAQPRTVAARDRQADTGRAAA